MYFTEAPFGMLKPMSVHHFKISENTISTGSLYLIKLCNNSKSCTSSGSTNSMKSFKGKPVRFLIWVLIQFQYENCER